MSVRVHLARGAVKSENFNMNRDDFFRLQSGKILCTTLFSAHLSNRL
jgi:hypothetical protein